MLPNRMFPARGKQYDFLPRDLSMKIRVTIRLSARRVDEAVAGMEAANAAVSANAKAVRLGQPGQGAE